MNSNQNWTPPDGLGYSSLRPVRLSGQGIVLAVLAGLLVVGGVMLGIFLAGKVRREAVERSLLDSQGVTANAVVTRHWLTGDKSPEPRISYRFEYQGSIYTRSVAAPMARWQELPVGTTLPVRLVPSQPAISHPVDWQSRGLPPWFPYAIAAFTSLLGLVPVLLITRQMKLLAEGRPAPGRMVGTRKSKHGMAVRYEFRSLDGATRKGRSEVSKMPPEGSPLCVLYDPDNPRRNALYPLSLVRLG